MHEDGGARDVNMTIDDAEHIAPERRAEIIAKFPEFEREARVLGIPLLGGGRVFPIGEAAIIIPPFELPSHFALIGGMDFGWDHPFAAVKLAWDREADCVYVTNEYRIREQTPIVHAAALKPWGPQLLWAWPHDGHQHDKGSGTTLAAQYRTAGLKVMPGHATHPDGGYGLEAGLMAMFDRMKTGRFKVFESCVNWREEFRHYHRLDGLVVKNKDDLISASRVGVMVLRYARSPDLMHHIQTTADGRYNPLDGPPIGNNAVGSIGGIVYGDTRRTREEHAYDILR
jgi:hypothetical protein